MAEVMALGGLGLYLLLFIGFIYWSEHRRSHLSRRRAVQGCLAAQARPAPTAHAPLGLVGVSPAGPVRPPRASRSGPGRGGVGAAQSSVAARVSGPAAATEPRGGS